MPNSSKPDKYGQTGMGLRDLLRRFHAATTREEFQWLAAEAERRGARSGLEPTIETAYGVLASLAANAWWRSRVAKVLMRKGKPELAGNVPDHLTSDTRGAMSERIVFLCPHGAAKSVIAAAYCQQLADQWGVPLRATAAGTEPDAEVLPAVVALLRMEGIDVANQRPRRVTPEELATASRIISLGCDLGDLARPGMVIEHWDDVPPPSQNLLVTRDQIGAHVEQLLAAIKLADVRAPDTSREHRDDHDG